MRYFALLAVVTVLCGCGSHAAKGPESATDSKALDGAVVDAAAKTGDAKSDETDSDKGTLREVQKMTANGKLGAAVELCGNYIGKHPESAQAFRLRAQANALRHNDADAVADFSTAIKIEPKYANHYVARGFFQLTRGNTSAAIEDFNKAIELDPKNSAAYNDLGMVHVTTGELKQGLKDFNRAIELDPKSVTAYTNRSFALVKLDRRQDGLVDLDKAIQLDPKAAGAYNSRGALRMEEHDYTKAIADFTSAIKVDSYNANYYSHRREAYLKLERFAEAQADGTRIERLMQLTALTEAVYRNRLSPKPYIDRGDFLLDEGRIDDAMANYDHALELDAKQSRSLVGRACAWIRKKEFQKAIDDSTAALKIDSSEDAYGVRGDAFRKLGQFAKAVADYDAAQRIDADVAETWLAYSRELREAGRSSESDRALKRANELKSLDAPRVTRVAATAVSRPK